MRHIEQWYAEQTADQKKWYDNLDADFKVKFAKHIEETWTFLNSVLAANDLSRTQFEALTENERFTVIGKHMTATVH